MLSHCIVPEFYIKEKGCVGMEREIKRLKNLRPQDIECVTGEVVEEVYCDCRDTKTKEAKYKAVVSTDKESYITEISVGQYERFIHGMSVRIGRE